MIHLDTSFLIRALVSGSPEDSWLRSWLVKREAITMSCIAWAEFLCGPLELDEVDLASRFIQEQLPFMPEDSVEAARLYNLGGRRRGSMIDCMVAATAMRSSAFLATSNPADFRKLQQAGLKLLP